MNQLDPIEAKDRIASQIVHSAGMLYVIDTLIIKIRQTDTLFDKCQNIMDFIIWMIHAMYNTYAIVVVK